MYILRKWWWVFSQHNFEVINENDAAGSIQKQNTINKCVNKMEADI